MANSIASQAASKTLLDNREEVYNLSLTFTLLIAMLITFLPDIAHAAAGGGGGAAGGAGADPLSRTICLVVGWLTGGVGQAIATMGIVMLGIGAMMGKVSWQMALIVAFGLSVMFSGARIVTLLTDHDAGFCVGDAAFTAGYIETVLCRVAEWANTAPGRALGTLAIVFLGISALMGKVSAGAALLLGAGIGSMYGADDLGRELVESMGGAWIACSPAVA
jgi:type IV secretory pathway VirB2 component (pilin)